jgi:hypothetical protein
LNVYDDGFRTAKLARIDDEQAEDLSNVLEEQKRIIVALDGLFENGQRLARIYEQKLAALDALKKSLLHQAFSGEL